MSKLLTYNTSFRQYIEDHLLYIRTHPTTEIVQIDGGLAYKNSGDFYGLLSDMKVPNFLHWPLLRINDMTNPYSFNEDMLTLVKIDLDLYERLVIMFNTTAGAKSFK